MTLSGPVMPISTTVKTASYQIPTGRVARVTICLVGNASFSLDGVLALVGAQNSVLASDNFSVTNGTETGTPAAGTLATYGGTGLGGQGSAFNETQSQKVLTASIMVPQGVTINGANNSGSWRAIVEEYNA